MKVLPRPSFAADRDVAAEHPREAPADAEAEPGAAEVARDRAVRLHEGLEDRVQRVGPDADASVRHADAEPSLGTFRVELCGDRHAASLGELDRVGDEIGDDLPHACRIGSNRLGQRTFRLEAQREALLPRLDRRAR